MNTVDQHVDDDTLALAAVGERLPASQAAHLTSCPRCADELMSLRHVVRSIRSDDHVDDVTPVAPPASVWAAVAAATGVRAVPPAAKASGHPPRRAVPLRRAVRGGHGGRGGHWPLAVAAALVVGVALGAVAAGLAQRDAPAAAEVAAAEVIASAALAPLGGADLQGNAAVHLTPSGHALDVRMAVPSAGTGFYQVWLLDAGASRMTPLGVIADDGGTYTIPAGMDLGEYPVVDISLEPGDGDPAHSGNSVARGVLD